MARLNENENENESTGGSGGLFSGALFNTYKIGKHAFDPNAQLLPVGRDTPLPKYDEMAGWDAENKSWIYIIEFMGRKPDWFSKLHTVARGAWPGWNLATTAGKTELNSALKEIIDAAGEREDRFAEICHQRDADGCIAYWLDMLTIDPVKQRNTYQLIRFARKLGEMIVMSLKSEINAARPSQICPAIVPAFEPPRTASYPAGHALQSYLMSYLLLRVAPGIPQSSKPIQRDAGGAPVLDAGGNETPSWDVQHEGLFALARRVADNRVIAGVHFDIDNKGGFLVAQKIDEWFGTWMADPDFAKTELGTLLNAAKGEFPQYN